MYIYIYIYIYTYKYKHMQTYANPKHTGFSMVSHFAKC